MLRALALLLVVANLMFFAWARGWLAPGWPGPRHGESEPERLAAQVRPEWVVVVPPAAASATVAAARAANRACLEAGPFNISEAGAAEAALTQAGFSAGSWQRVDALPGPSASPSASPAASQWLRFAPADVDLQARLRGLADPALGSGFQPCASGR